MAKSIMQSVKECYLCRKAAEAAGYYGDLPGTGLHKHHVVFGMGNRTKSEHYGLWVYLCVPHHELGPEAVHKNEETRDELCCEAQEVFEREYPNLSFREEFGKSWI